MPIRIEWDNFCNSNSIQIRFQYDYSADCDGDGILDECAMENCDNNAWHDACQYDEDDDGVPSTCDACPGFDDNIDTDGDGTADGCDLCEGIDDKDPSFDCNRDGMPDPCQLEASYSDQLESSNSTLPCDLSGDTISLFYAPPTFGDVTVSVDLLVQNINDADESIDFSDSFARTRSCTCRCRAR